MCMEESATLWTEMFNTVWQSTCCLCLAYSSLHYSTACLFTLVRCILPFMSKARFSHMSGSMKKSLRGAFKVSLKHFFWPPVDLFPSISSQNSKDIGRCSSSILSTWTAQYNWALHRQMWLLKSSAWLRTSVSGTLCHHWIWRSLHKQLRSNWLSFLTCLLYMLHVSQAYRRVERTITLYTLSFVCAERP